MRLRRLDLLRFGRFTQRSIELPASDCDLHIIFGPNEAGKSTALAAIEDLLFGIPMQSPFNFLHDYKDLRIGALLEHGGESLEFRRRKGNKDTLLGPDDLALPGGEALLLPFLAGADRAFFERMFSLDHRRLEQGGREILDARDEIGQMLFSAGAGIGGIRERLRALEEEADSLWGARKASRRRYSQVEDQLEQAERELREQTLTAAQWQERKKAFVAAETVLSGLQRDYEQYHAEERRLERIRRVYRDVRRVQDLKTEIRAHGSVAPLPEGAAVELAEAERALFEATTRIDTLSGQLRQARDGLHGLPGDPALLQRADDVQLLHERRIETRRARADLPKRQAELDAAEAQLRGLARELGWENDGLEEVIATIPPRARVGVVRDLLGERGEHESKVAASREALRSVEDRQRRLREHREVMSEVRDPGGLPALIRSVRDLGDVSGRLRTVEAELAEARRRCQHLHAGLHPSVDAPEVMVAMQVPTRAEVQRHRDRLLDWEQRDAEIARQVEAATTSLARVRLTLERSLGDGGDVTGEQLAEARRHRDELWDWVRRRYVLGETITGSEQEHLAVELEDLPGSFTVALQAADEIADRRFDDAEALGRLAELARSVGEHEATLENLHRQRTMLGEEGARLQAAWLALWDKVPFEPLSPDAMLVWLDARDELVQALQRRDEASVREAVQRREAEQARASLRAELKNLGEPTTVLAAESLPALLERATEVLQDCEQANRERQSTAQTLRELDAERERRRGELEQAESARAAWLERWRLAVVALGLLPESEPREVARQVDTIDEMRGLAQRIHGLRQDRIGRIRADIADYEQAVAGFVADVAPDLLGLPADDAVLRIEEQLAQAREIQQLRRDREAKLRQLEDEMAELETALGRSRQVIDRLRAVAGVETVEALREAIERSDALRRMRDELDATVRALEQEGDGLPVAELEQECAAADMDRIVARQETLRQQLAEVRERRDEAVEERSRARTAFEAIGGDDSAARAAAARQEALAELGMVAERYVRARSSAVLLQWAIDRYRREKQAPLLSRAGDLFATLTQGAFTALSVEYDERDQPHLTGLRATGDRVPVPGLSTGTADQLFLALRVAAIEDYLDHAPGLPFVADDLFINFDDARSSAGLDVLAQLATRTQVLFFTHHQHLVDLAQARLGDAAHVELLSETSD